METLANIYRNEKAEKKKIESLLENLILIKYPNNKKRKLFSDFIILLFRANIRINRKILRAIKEEKETLSGLLKQRKEFSSFVFGTLQPTIRQNKNISFSAWEKLILSLLNEVPENFVKEQDYIRKLELNLMLGSLGIELIN